MKGSGRAARGETRVPTLKRDSRTARLVASRRSLPPFVVEHATFALGLIPLLARRRPDVVYFSEWHVGRLLALWRRAARARFALVFCNGALVPGGYDHLDLVQQLVPGAIEYTVERGGSPERQVFLPLGVAMDESPPPAPDERRRLRQRLGLPDGRLVVLSAGAINRQKRMDFLIEEVASLAEPRPFLLLLGQEEADSAAIRRLARDRLGSGGHAIGSVPPRAMADHYRASDAFVLCSLWESFGRALVEAQSHGLPCLAHAYPVMEWVLGDEGDTADLRRPGSVASWLAALTADPEAEARRRRSARERFSWPILADRYAEMLRAAAGARRGRTARTG